ncbi:TRAP transporter substrate-binding protein [Actinomyces sp. B33]|uniref:TRAP transporter substrate-binding protein n=1 Tax=Actinomyces sp. B33 TaxID=2942131 RepID=UPI002341A336|nr:TRAP transporter substrate-binding protein [Actinomyces sp. B33]MDC4233338.1 TRAP transporter substrate-binding protein [Actinomyces sp. B33]
MLRRTSVVSGLAAVIAATTLLAGCAGGAGPRATDSIRIILGHGAAPGNPRSEAALKFEELVEAKSNHTIDVQILGQEAVGSDSEMMVSVSSGTLDMSINSQGPFATYVPEAALIGLPFLFENSEHAYSIVDDDEIHNYLAEEAEPAGFHVLGFWDNGLRDITNSKREINTPDDLKGLKIRTPDDTMTISIFNQLGANPTPMAFGELYLALRTGAVDGQENPVVNIKSSKLNEVQPHLASTGHKYETNPFVISTMRWARLTPDQQKIIQEAADEARDYQRDLMAEQTEAIYDEFEQSLTVTHPDKDAFREATKPVYDQWQAKYPEFFQKITEAAQANRADFAGKE